MTNPTTPEQLAAHIQHSAQAIAVADQLLSKAAQTEQALQQNAPALADQLIALGYLRPDEKSAAVQKLSDPASIQLVLGNLLKQAAPKNAAPTSSPVGRGVTTKAASAYGIPSRDEAVGVGTGSLYDPIICGGNRSMNDPVVLRRSEGLRKLAGLQ